VPDRYGDAAAVQAMSSVAAPLLASGSLVFIGLVLKSVRYPGWTVLVMMIALVALIAAVQCGFWARQHASTPEEIEQWWPDMPAGMRAARARADQWQDRASHDLWANRARWAYGVGIFLLWLGAAVAVMPPPNASEATLRWVASGTGVIAAAAEVLWVTASRGRGPRWLIRWLSGPVVSPPPELPPTTG
jgi:hypothetical protein